MLARLLASAGPAPAPERRYSDRVERRWDGVPGRRRVVGSRRTPRNTPLEPPDSSFGSSRTPSSPRRNRAARRGAQLPGLDLRRAPSEQTCHGALLGGRAGSVRACPNSVACGAGSTSHRRASPGTAAHAQTPPLAAWSEQAPRSSCACRRTRASSRASGPDHDHPRDFRTCQARPRLRKSEGTGADGMDERTLARVELVVVEPVCWPGAGPSGPAYARWLDARQPALLADLKYAAPGPVPGLRQCAARLAVRVGSARPGRTC